MILLTGASGMLGSYLKEEFADEVIKTLGRSAGNDYVCDLSKDTPDFGEEKFETVIHTAGTEEPGEAMELNYGGTQRLLAALEDNPPQNFVYISSYRVYNPDAGEGVDEDTNPSPTDETGKSKVLAEKMVIEWCERHDIAITIVRPARMFGNGVKGDTLRLFNDALSGKYIHIRGNDARVSIVCALDVARGIQRVYKRGGLYNASDGRPVKLIEMVEAMTANAGAKKRMNHLPADWAEWLWRFGRWIPSIDRNLSPKMVESRLKTMTMDSGRLVEKSGIEFHDTLAVIERRDPRYPYTEIPNQLSKISKYEL